MDRHRILEEIIKRAPEQDIAKLERKGPISDTTQAKIRENNYFVAEFMFEVLGGRFIYVNIPMVELDRLNDYYYKEKSLFFDDHLVTVNLHFSSKSYKSADQFAVISGMKSLHADFFALAKAKNEYLGLMSANLLNTIQDRHRLYQTQPSYIFLNTDSEAYMLGYLQTSRVWDALRVQIQEQIINKKFKVNRIIFNACTTRAMCGICGTNMAIFQYLANEQNYAEIPTHFFGKIKKLLIDKGNTEVLCPITTYISSLNGDSVWFEVDLQEPHDQQVNIFCLPR